MEGEVQRFFAMATQSIACWSIVSREGLGGDWAGWCLCLFFFHLSLALFLVQLQVAGGLRDLAALTTPKAMGRTSTLTIPNAMG